MEDQNILLWALGVGFTILFGAFVFGFKILRDDIKSVREELKLLRTDVQDIDRRLCRLEGAFSSKDCCMIKDHRTHEKAE